MALRQPEQKALTLSRKGFSSSGIAREIGVTESTARKYLDTIEDELGFDVLVNY